METVAGMFKKYYPHRHEFYEWVKQQSEPKEGVGEMWSGPWCTLALNLNSGPISPHKDTRDYHKGLSFIMIFGDFTGGSVYFPDLKLELPVQPGCIYALQGSVIKHEVKSYTGDRYSLVFFTQEACVVKACNSESHVPQTLPKFMLPVVLK